MTPPECPLLLVDRSLPAWRVVEALDSSGAAPPLAIVCDNGPEFVSQALDHWASRQGIHLDFIRPGHPVENCFIESFNGKLQRVPQPVPLRHAGRSPTPHRAVAPGVQHRAADSPGNSTPAEYAARFTPEEGHSSTLILRS
ncbi:MAG: transposase family protein [Gemmatimonadetes bacterium]|nr:transposase family protein [Gemmatimonadota bacterium]